MAQIHAVFQSLAEYAKVIYYTFFIFAFLTKC